MSLNVSKSVQPSPRNRCEIEKVRIRRLRHLNRYISGTGSVCQMTSELDQWPDKTFKMSPSVSKSVTAISEKQMWVWKRANFSLTLLKPLYLQNRKCLPNDLQTWSMAQYYLSNEPKYVQIGLTISEKQMWDRKSANLPPTSLKPLHLRNQKCSPNDLRTWSMARYYLSNEPKCIQIDSTISEKQMWVWKRANFSLTLLKPLYLRNRKCLPNDLRIWSTARYYLSNEPKCVQIGSTISEKQMWDRKSANLRLRHLNRYISGTGSLRQITSKLDQWLYITFQMRLSVSKSIQPSLRNRCEF